MKKRNGVVGRDDANVRLNAIAMPVNESDDEWVGYMRGSEDQLDRDSESLFGTASALEAGRRVGWATKATGWVVGTCLRKLSR